MPCSHPRTKRLLVRDRERQEDVDVIICPECGRILDVSFPGRYMGEASSEAERVAEIVY